jgi:tripeptide aminopeptidase
MRFQPKRSDTEVSASDVEHVIRDTLGLARIPAPTFHEELRGNALANGLREAGLRVELDAVGNVIGYADVGGHLHKPAVAVLAHLDTVFPLDTPLKVELHGDRLVGPGVGDNALALAALLWLARVMKDQRGNLNLIFVGTVGEEGLGDLRGARAFASNHCNVTAAVVLEGHYLGRIIHAGPGSRRIRVAFRGPGGHSWDDFGEVSAVHEILHVGANLTHLPLPQETKTTLNIGVLAGGQSVNSIAADACMLIDVRSASEHTLTSLVSAVRSELAIAARSTRITMQVDDVGDRPAASIAPDHWLVLQAVVASKEVGIEAKLDMASTDANALLAADIPTVATGISLGGNMHRLDEWVAVAPIAAGLRQLGRLTQALLKVDI